MADKQAKEGHNSSSCCASNGRQQGFPAVLPSMIPSNTWLVVLFGVLLTDCGNNPQIIGIWGETQGPAEVRTRSTLDLSTDNGTPVVPGCDAQPGFVNQCSGAEYECNDDNDVPWDGCTNHKITEFKVNSSEDEASMQVDVAFLGNGGFIVVWDMATVFYPFAASSIRGRTFSPEGWPLMDEFHITEATSNQLDEQQASPALVKMTDENCFVVWKATGPEPAPALGAGIVHIEGGILDPLTGTLLSRFSVSTTEDVELAWPVVEATSSGNILVGWQGRAGVYVRRFSPVGEPLGDDSLLAAYDTAGWIGGMCPADDESFLLIRSEWETKYDLAITSIKTTRMEFSGPSTLSWPSVVESNESLVFMPQIVFADGIATALWHSYELENDKSVAAMWAQPFLPSGYALDHEVLLEVFHQDTVYSADMVQPQVVSQGKELVGAWRRNEKGLGLALHRFAPTGTATAESVPLNLLNKGNQMSPELSVYEEDQTLIAVWISSAWPFLDQPCSEIPTVCGVFAQRFSPTGARLYR